LKIALLSARHQPDTATTRLDQQLLAGNAQAAAHLLAEWTKVQPRTVADLTLTDFEHVDLGNCDLVLLGGTITGLAGHQYLKAISERYEVTVKLDEFDESDNFIQVGDLSWHLDWSAQVVDLTEDFALIVIDDNPFGVKPNGRGIFIGGFTSLATLSASRWVTDVLPQRTPEGVDGGSRQAGQIAVLRFDVANSVVTRTEVLFHHRLQDLRDQANQARAKTAATDGKTDLKQ
jgi:hypothetical protein